MDRLRPLECFKSYLNYAFLVRGPSFKHDTTARGETVRQGQNPSHGSHKTTESIS